MTPKPLRSLFYVLLAGCLAISSGLMGSENRPVYSGLTAHEWGPFTSIAGDRGQAVEWSPLTGSTDPPGFVNTVLPLSIAPAPAQTVRVFVGRLEIVTPATKRAVERALANHEGATLEKYGRFLEPILQSMIKKESNPGRVRQIEDSLSVNWSAEVAKNRVGE
jgi:hypothetical protein